MCVVVVVVLISVCTPVMEYPINFAGVQDSEYVNQQTQPEKINKAQNTCVKWIKL